VTSDTNYGSVDNSNYFSSNSYGSPSYYSPPSSNNWEDDYADEDDDYYDETTAAPPPNNPWSGITQPPVWNNNYNNDVNLKEERKIMR